MLGKRFKSWDIACWDKWERMFLNLRVFLSETQYSSDKRSKIRILKKRALFRILYQTFGQYRKKNWWIYIYQENLISDEK